MKTGIMAAACAAMMACGWAGTAEAYTVKLDAAAADYFSASQIDFSFGSGPGQGFLNYSENLDEGDAVFSISSNFVTGDVSHVKCGTNCIETVISGIFHNVVFDGYNADGGAISGDQQFHVYIGGVYHDPAIGDTQYVSFDVAGYGSAEYTNDAPYSATYSLSIVPLPSTAPLLGYGLIALGSLGYARRRRSAA